MLDSSFFIAFQIYPTRGVDGTLEKRFGCLKPHLLRLFSIDGIVRHHRTLSCLAIDLLIVGTNHLYFIIVISASESSLLIGVTLFADAFVIISVLSVDVMMMRSVVMTIVDRQYPLTGTTHYARGRTKFK